MTKQELIGEILQRFPGIEDPEADMNGTDTVDSLCEWFSALCDEVRTINALVDRAKKAQLRTSALEDSVNDKALFEATLVRTVEEQIRFLAEDPDQLGVIEESVACAENGTSG